MAGQRQYEDAVAHSLGSDEARLLSARTLRGSQIGMARISSDAARTGRTPRIPIEDTFIAVVHLTPLDHELSSSGKRAIAQDFAAQSMRIVNLEAEYAALIASAREAVCFYISRVALNAFTDETGSRVGRLSCPPGIIDPVIANLVQALLPTFERPREFPSIFTDHIGSAVLAHLVHRYGDIAAGHPRAIRGGLSLVQERRAKEYLMARISGNVLLADVARSCGLSRGYFISAFAQTTGLTPHKWLQRYRLQKSRTLLLESSISIAEIAVMCGFADQSHLTRTFTQAVGTSPAAWRRAHSPRQRPDVPVK